MENNSNNFNQRVFALFQTDITSILRNKFEWMSQMGIDTFVIDSWSYWEYEEFIRLLNDKNKEETEQRKKQDETEQSKYGNMGNFNPGKMMNGFSPGNVMKNFGSMGNNSAFPRI